MFRLTRVSDSGNTVFARKCIQRAEVENNNIFFRQLRQSILRGGGGGEGGSRNKKELHNNIIVKNGQLTHYTSPYTISVYLHLRHRFHAIVFKLRILPDSMSNGVMVAAPPPPPRSYAYANYYHYFIFIII